MSALSLALKSPARLHAVEIAVDVDLQKSLGVIRRSTCCSRFGAFKAQCREIESIHASIDRSNWVVFSDPIIEPLGE
jgi:hypothetical protein